MKLKVTLKSISAIISLICVGLRPIKILRIKNSQYPAKFRTVNHNHLQISYQF